MTGRTSRLVLLGLGAALVLLPLGLGLPGLPASLRADETSYYFLARSLASDADSAVDVRDVDRIYREMPYAGRELLALGLDGAERIEEPGLPGPPRWAVSPLYSLALVPAVSAARTNGAFAFNALCFVLALALLGRALARRAGPDDASLGWTLAGAALFLSGAFVHVWWIHPATLRLLLVAAAFALAWPTRVDPSTYSPLRSGLRLAAAGAFLGLCVGEVPWLALLLPALLTRHRASWRRAGAVLAGAAAGVGVALLASWLVLGHLSPDGFSQRSVVQITSPDDRPWLDDALAPPPHDGLVAAPSLGTKAERVGLAFFDRRRGLFLLFPFAALFLLAAVRTRRTGRTRLADAPPAEDRLSRVVLGAGLAVLVVSRPFVHGLDPATAALELERFGDPVLTAAWPAAFFLVAALPGAASLLLAVGVSGLLLLPAIFTPFGPAVAGADAHHAARGATAYLPMGLEEVSVAAGWDVYHLPGPADDGLRLWAPSYATHEHASAVALLGGERVELWLEARRPVAAVHLDARSYAPGNRLTLRFAGGRERHHGPGVEPPDSIRLRLPLATGDVDGWRRARRADGTEVWISRMVASTTRGERPQWRTETPESFYVGALFTFLGSDAHVQRDVYGVRWAACGAPPSAAPGEELKVLVRLRNISESTWLTDGPVSVRLAHRWHDASGGVVEGSGRTALDGPLASGEEALAWVAAEAPSRPGTWRLEIEPVYEMVAWFSDRMDDADAAVCRAEVVVAP